MALQLAEKATHAEVALQDLTDEALIIQYRESGERAIYEVLISRYEREIFSYLRRYMGNVEMAEDAFQGTFLHVHLKCHQFDAKRRFRPCCTQSQPTKRSILSVATNAIAWSAWIEPPDRTTISVRAVGPTNWSVRCQTHC